MTLIAARQLGTAAFGNVALGLAVLNLLAVAAQAGLSQSSSRFIGEYLGRKETGTLRGFVNTVQWVPLVSGLLIAAVGISALSLAGFGRDVTAVLNVTLLGVPALGSLMLSQNIARGFGRMLLATMPVPVMLPAVALLSFLAGPAAPDSAAEFMNWYVAIAAALAVSALLVLNLRRSAEMPSGAPVLREPGRWWQVSWPMFVTALGQQFLRRADVMILAPMVSPQTLGLYALGSRFAQVIAVARYAVNRYSMPQIARAFAAAELAAVESAARHSTRLVLAATVFVAAALLIAGKPVLAFSGDAEGAAYGFMLVLLAGQTLASFRSASLQTLQMCGFERDANTIVLVSSPLLAIGGGIAAALSGAMGMAVAVGLLTTWQYWFADHRVSRLVGVNTAPFGRRRHTGRDAISDETEQRIDDEG